MTALPHIHKRNRKSHKGQNGHVLLVGGSSRFVGAAALAGLSALRSGVDYVTIAAPEKVAWTLNKLSPDFVTVKLPGTALSKSHFTQIKKLSSTADVILTGNGAGRLPKTRSLISQLAHLEPANVLDADALRVVRIQDWFRTIFTPHQSEFTSLLKNSKLTKTNFQKALGDNVILLKGPIDHIYSSKRTYQNKTGNSGMSVAGSGDVLAGLTAGLLAQNNSLVNSARIAAYINGRIGEKLYAKHGYGYTASDMAQLVGKEVATYVRASA